MNEYVQYLNELKALVKLKQAYFDKSMQRLRKEITRLENKLAGKKRGQK